MKDRKESSFEQAIPNVNRRLNMKYAKEQRLDIGHKLYSGEITRRQAAEIYCISEQSARDYMRLYRDSENLPRQMSNSFKRF